MTRQHIRKKYTAREFTGAIEALEDIGVADPAELVKQLYKRGYRVVYAGKLRFEGDLDRNP